MFQHKLLLVFLIGAIILFSFAECQANANANKENFGKNFEWNFVKAAISSTNGNIAVSPFSVKFILALIKESLEYNSVASKELINAIPELKGRFIIGKQIENILKLIQERSEYNEVEIKSKIFSRMENKVDLAFATVAKDRYHVDFKYTNLKDVISVLLNQLHFRAAWSEEFTKVFQSFWYPRISGHEDYRYKIQYIQNENMNILYHKSNKFNVDIYRIPYRIDNISMTIIYPRNGKFLDDVLQKIDGKTFKILKNSLKYEKINVVWPKFNFSSQIDLKKVLAKLNIKNLFSNDVDFLTFGDENIKTGYFNQTASIIFDERGSGAKASTFIPLVKRNHVGSAPHIVQDKFKNIKNKPFMYLIEDLSSNSILFAGKVAFPNPV